MAYYQKVMQPGEVLRYAGSLHWVVFVPSLATFALGIAVGLSASTVAHAQAENADSIDFALKLIAAVLLLYGIIKFLGAAIRRSTTEIIITDRRVLYKRGIISRHTIEMNISKIETVDVSQTISGRLLGYGTVFVRGTGAGLEPLTRVAHPLLLRNAILAG
jgi:uncharacterized membrane protein YdbT with pleckstrin-like domain